MRGFITGFIVQLKKSLQIGIEIISPAHDHTASKWAAKIQTQVVSLVWPLFKQDLNTLTLFTTATLTQKWPSPCF